jgi:hypothetical protein
MHSAVMILPMPLAAAGNMLAEAMGWGPNSYTIPLVAEGSETATHMGLRADVSASFIEMIGDARRGVYPPGLPEAALRPVIEALVADFSPDPASPDRPALWGADHLDAVCAAHVLSTLLTVVGTRWLDFIYAATFTLRVPKSFFWTRFSTCCDHNSRANFRSAKNSCRW